MRLPSSIICLSVACTLLTSPSFAEDKSLEKPTQADSELKPLPANEAGPIATRYIELIKTISSPPFKFELDIPHAVVLQSKDSKIEVVLIPAAGQQLDAEDALLGQDRGAPIGWMFFKGLIPAVRSKLPGRQSFPVEVNEHPMTAAFQVSVRRHQSGILRMEWWGEGDGPVAATALRPASKSMGDKFELRYISGLLYGSGIAKSLFFLPMDPVMSP